MSLRKAPKVLILKKHCLYFSRVFLLMTFAEMDFLGHSMPLLLCMSYELRTFNFQEKTAALRKSINLLPGG